MFETKLNLFKNRAKYHIATLMYEVAVNGVTGHDTDEKLSDATELLSFLDTLECPVLDWTEYKLSQYMEYWTEQCKLVESGTTVQTFDSTLVLSDPEGGVIDLTLYARQVSVDALVILLNQHIVSSDSEFLELRNAIASLDFSTLLPQEVQDSIDASAAARHTHANLAILNAINQTTLDTVAANEAHVLNNAIHLSQGQADKITAAATTSELVSGLAAKAPTEHQHIINEVAGLADAIAALPPGLPGNDGTTPSIKIGSVDEGLIPSASMDNTDPFNPILNLVLKSGSDGSSGTSFSIDESGPASGRLTGAYEAELDTFYYLGTDTRLLYKRNVAAPSTSMSGWISFPFLGDSGWSPSLALEPRSAGGFALRVFNWVGGSGDKPTALGYVGLNGLMDTANLAIDISGPKGDKGDIGKMSFPDASGLSASLSNYNGEDKDFVYYSTDSGVINKKLSGTSGDWSPPYAWRGPTGVASDGDPAPQVIVQYHQDSGTWHDTPTGTVVGMRFSVDGGFTYGDEVLLSSGSGSSTYTSKVSATDTTASYLDDKQKVGDEFTNEIVNPDGNENLLLKFKGWIYNAARTFYTEISSTLLTKNVTLTVQDKSYTIADDAEVVKITGTQTIDGVKSFTKQAYSSEHVQAFSAAVTFDLDNGNTQSAVISSISTLTLSNKQLGGQYNIDLLTNATGGYELTFDSTFGRVDGNGEASPLTVAADERIFVSISHTTNGTLTIITKII